jgi:hypothetical protein
MDANIDKAELAMFFVATDRIVCGINFELFEIIRKTSEFEVRRDFNRTKPLLYKINNDITQTYRFPRYIFMLRT